MSFQNVTIVGNVGRDADLQYTQQGIAVLKFSVAVNKTIGKGEQRRETVTWFNVTLWRDRGEALAAYVKAGMQVLVTGEVAVSPYIDKQGKAAASLELTASDLKLLTSRAEMERRGEVDYDADQEEQPVKPALKSNGNARPLQPAMQKGKRPPVDDQEIPF